MQDVQHFGPNGTINDMKPSTSFDDEMPGILAGKNKFVPKELSTFENDSTIIFGGLGLLQGGEQTKPDRINAQGNEDYKSVGGSY